MVRMLCTLLIAVTAGMIVNKEVSRSLLLKSKALIN